MNYLLKSKQQNPFKAKIIAIVSVFAVLAIFLIFFSQSTRSFFTTLSKPLWSVGGGISQGSGSVSGFFSSRATLVAEVSVQKDELALLKLKQIDYDAVLKENQDLKMMQNRAFSVHRTISRVLSKPPQSPYDTFVIDTGSQEGAVVGDLVYLSDTVVIGTISSVTTHTATVVLFSKGDTTHTVELSRTGSTYELTGRGGGNFVVEVPKESDVLWGDTFIYPSITTSVLGSVYYIETNPQSSFKKIYIRIPANIFQTKWVWVQRGE